MGNHSLFAILCSLSPVYPTLSTHTTPSHPFPSFLPQQPSPVVTLSQHLGGGHAQGLGLGSTGLNFEHEMDDVVMKSGDERIQTKASLTSVPSASGDMTGGTLPMMSISLPSSSTVGVLSPVLAGLLVKNNNSSSSSSSTGAT